MAARSTRTAMLVIGFLGGADLVGYAPQIEALRLGFRDYGYVKDELAADLVGRKVAVMITQGTPAALLAHPT
jgi:hypothetical protein